MTTDEIKKETINWLSDMGNSDQVEFSNKLALVYEAYNKLMGSDAKQLLEEIQKSEAWAICINDDIDSVFNIM